MVSLILMQLQRCWRQYTPKVSRSRNEIVEPLLLPKNKQTNLFFYSDDSEILETGNQKLSFKYFQVVKIEKKYVRLFFWEKLRLDNFVSRLTDEKIDK